MFEGKLFERPLLRPAEPSIWQVVNFFRGSEAILKKELLKTAVRK